MSDDLPAGQPNDDGSEKPHPTRENAALQALQTVLASLAKVRKTLHNLFDLGQSHTDVELPLGARLLAGFLGPYFPTPPIIAYYWKSDSEALHAFITVELLNAPYLLASWGFMGVIGAMIGASYEKGTVFGHAWRSLVDTIILFAVVWIIIRFVF